MQEKLLAGDLMPRSELVVPENHVPRSKFSAIDTHNHLPIDHLEMRAADLGELVRDMDLLNPDVLSGVE